MYCIKCGAELSYNARFCSKCGEASVSANVTDVDNDLALILTPINKNSPWTVFIIVVFTITVIVGGVLSWLMMSKHKLGDTRINPKDKAEMVWVPGGTFIMVTPIFNKGAPPTQTVTLPGYWIFKYEVTVAQYLKFCTATSRVLPPFPTDYSWMGKSGWTDPALQQHPIVNVTWFDCKAYADWAGVTLPTEAQWEYASYETQTVNNPWRSIAAIGEKHNNFANYNNSARIGKSTWPVGSFPAGASWCGAQDMIGNVWEWCADWYGGNNQNSSVTHPNGPLSGNVSVLRGGSWKEFNSIDSIDSRVYRFFSEFGYGNDYGKSNYGFRCVSL